MRSIPFYPLMVLCLVGLGGYLGCDADSIQLPAGLELNPPPQGEMAQNWTQPPAGSAAPMRLGSFNMQRLGPSKLSKPKVMEKFAAIIQQFDIIALQEITSKDQRTLPILVEKVNAAGGKYDYVISQRIGRKASGYYEQYAYVFDTTRIQGGKEFCYVVEDDRDVLHREPFVGRFQTISPHPFRFTLINIHTDPGEIKYELDVLADVFINVRQYEYPEDDVILLGDLNAGPGKLRALGKIEAFIPLINGQTTNTIRTKTHDNIMIDNRNTLEFTGHSGVLDLQDAFGVSLAEAKQISDHSPIWAEFSMEESPTSVTAMAGATPTTRR